MNLLTDPVKIIETDKYNPANYRLVLKELCEIKGAIYFAKKQKVKKATLDELRKDVEEKTASIMAWLRECYAEWGSTIYTEVDDGEGHWRLERGENEDLKLNMMNTLQRQDLVRQGYTQYHKDTKVSFMDGFTKDELVPADVVEIGDYDYVLAGK